VFFLGRPPPPKQTQNPIIPKSRYLHFKSNM
jgi:hypothetical protein